MSDILDSIANLNPNSLEYISAIELLEEEVLKIKHEINEMKKDELSRIGKEFMVNDYERRFNVKLDKLISALIGEEKSCSEVERIKRRRKVKYNNFRNICKVYKSVKVMIYSKE